MEKPCIIIADDDNDDQMLISLAFKEANVEATICKVYDGGDLMDYLGKKGKYRDTEIQFPKFILLDLNMPRMGGKEALLELKSHPLLKMIPVIVFSTSPRSEDVKACYEAGASCYIVKPALYEDLLKVVKYIDNFWVKTAITPDTCVILPEVYKYI